MLGTVASPGTFGCHDRRFFYRCTEVTDKKADTHYGLWFTLPTRLARFCASEGRKRVTSLAGSLFLPLCAFSPVFCIDQQTGFGPAVGGYPPDHPKALFSTKKKKKKKKLK